MKMPLCMKMLCFPIMLFIILPYSASLKCFPILYDRNYAFCIQTGCMQRVQDNSLRGSSLLACVDSREIKTCHFWHFTSSGKQTGLACVVKCPSPLPPCSKDVNTPPPIETRKSGVCIRLSSIRRQKHLSSLFFGRYSMFFSPFVTTCWIWYNLILVVFRRLGLRLFGLLRNQDPAKDQEWADKIRSSMQKFRLVLDKEGGFCIGNAVSLADVHCGPFLYRLSAARKHLVLLALGWFCAVLTHVDSLFQEATLLGRSKFI